MIYLDYNATTPICPEALEAMRPFLEKHFGNPSSVHAEGREARAGVDDARDRLARLLGVEPHELIFTSGGTESNNLAILGLARAHRSRGRHLICPLTEHHAVLHSFQHLKEREGFEVTFLPVDDAGLIDPPELERAIRDDTILVSIMRANNETGVIQPLDDLSMMCEKRGVLLHSDMVQSFGKLETSLGQSRLAAASFAAHKFHGPKGAGLLYLRSGLSIEAVQYGGAHENQRRPGTENVAAIVGMAAAAEWILSDMAAEQERQGALRDRLSKRITELLPFAQRNGSGSAQLANTLNVSFTGVESETTLMGLDLEGVCASSGSACMVGSVVPSHVLLGMGLSETRARSAIRFSLGNETTAEEIDRAGEIIEAVVLRISSAKSQESAEVYVA